MNYYSVCLRRFLLLFLVGVTNFSFAQINDKETVEQILYDIKTRNFDRLIRLISNELLNMEQVPIGEFQDSVYIGLTGLLTTAYVQNDQIDDAEKLLTHAINFFDGNTRKSPLVYQLYYAYGAFSASIENYETAKIFLEATIDYLRNLDSYDEEYAVILSVLAICHMKTDQLQLSYDEIMESVSIIEKSSSQFTLSNSIQIYEKAGTICYEIYQSQTQENSSTIFNHNLYSEGKNFIKKAYDLSRGRDEYTSEFINAGFDLATIYLDEGNYSEALSIFHQLEYLRLSDIEKNKIYNGIAMANYYLGDKEESAKYMLKSSDILKEISVDMFLSFPLKEQENIWASNSMQLKLNMNILDKFPENKEILRMSYDNALFLKGLTYEYYDYLRSASRDNHASVTLSNIKQLRSKIFAMDLKKDVLSYRNELKELEKLFLNELQTSGNGIEVSQLPSWQKVRDCLREGEFAIEFISYTGFEGIGEEKNLRYAALALSSQMESPKFIDLCKFDELLELYFNVLTQQELGFNNLYKRDSNNVLYKLFWEKLDPLLENATTIYCSPILNIQNINLAYIVCPDGRYLNEKYDIRILSSTGNVCDRKDTFEMSGAALFGGINYSNESAGTKSTFRDIIYEEINDSTRSGFGYLPASKKEVENIKACLSDSTFPVELYIGNDASESSFCCMDGNSPSLIHVATHAFYLVGFDKYMDYFQKLIPYSYKDETMLLTGLLFSGANNTLRNKESNIQLYDGVLTSEEISLLDLSNTDLVVLSACNSSLGQAFQEGYGGLVRAFKLAGVRHLLVSLWPVSDEATSIIMTNFYKHLINGTEMHAALKKAQQETAMLYPDPYYWASFILLD